MSTGTITLRFTLGREELFKSYAEHCNITLSEAMRNAMIEKIEDGMT